MLNRDARMGFAVEGAKDIVEAMRSGFSCGGRRVCGAWTRVHLLGSLILVGTTVVLACMLSGCVSSDESNSSDEASISAQVAAVNVISSEEAHDRMTSDRTVILDVRTQEEFDEAHICNAVLLPCDSITAETAQEVAPDKNKAVLVYCRTGRRSAEAASRLVELGYTQVYDFGGIESWPYDVCFDEKGDESTVENDELPVGVKVVCGKTRSLPEE